jgi:hypothetical protein
MTEPASLVRLLKIVQEAGKDGISTKKLCEQAFKTRNYGCNCSLLNLGECAQLFHSLDELTAIVVTLVAASILFFLGEASAKPIEEMPCDGCGNGGFP